jgi:hypothetical protein
MELSQFVNSRFADDSVLGELRVQFQTAEPFPWIVLENFLTRNFVDRLSPIFHSRVPITRNTASATTARSVRTTRTRTRRSFLPLFGCSTR